MKVSQGIRSIISWIAIRKYTAVATIEDDSVGRAIVESKWDLELAQFASKIKIPYSKPMQSFLFRSSYSEQATLLSSPSPLGNGSTPYSDGGKPTTKGSTDPATLPPVAGIGFIGSLAICVNNITGPGMLDLPSTFQKSGFIPTILTTILVSALSASISLSLANSIGKVKVMGSSNRNFSHHFEYSDVFRYYYGSMAFGITQVLFYFCVLSQCVASIVSTAQVVDASIASLFGSTHAVQFGGRENHPSVPSGASIWIDSWSPGDCDAGDDCLPFQTLLFGPIIITLGYVVTALLLGPLGLMDMKENVSTQLLSFVLLLVFLVSFTITFLTSDSVDISNVPLFGSSYTSLLGVVMFNFGLTATIPAWLHEKVGEGGATAAMSEANCENACGCGCEERSHEQKVVSDLWLEICSSRTSLGLASLVRSSYK